MLRYLLFIVLLVHGLIHLLAFLKAFGLADVSQLSGRTLFPLSPPGIRAAGVLWLLSTILFTATAVLVLFGQNDWWMPGIAALLLSQILIVLYWPDARYGTAVNVLLLLALLPVYGQWRFQRMVRAELTDFLPRERFEKNIVDSARIALLPPPVQTWMNRSRVVGKPVVHRAQLTQIGEMRTTPDGKWMPFTAEQYFTFDQPGFIWTTKVKAAPFLTLSGRDLYRDGHGHMLIQLLSLFPVADAKGPEIDQGTLLRFMGELVWFPSGLLNEYIRWEPVDDHSAKATMRYGNVTASGLFRFDAAGDFESFEAQRFYDRKEGATLETWHIQVLENGFKTFNGVHIPARMEVTWKLDSGDFTWLRLEIETLEYNPSAR